MLLIRTRMYREECEELGFRIRSKIDVESPDDRSVIIVFMVVR